MPEQSMELLDNCPLGRELGAIYPVETWWAERQEALERAGYMLRLRYRPGWKPSWAGTNKDYFRCEDGVKKYVRSDAFIVC
jgi:hypothetical protein